MDYNDKIKRSPGKAPLAVEVALPSYVFSQRFVEKTQEGRGSQIPCPTVIAYGWGKRGHINHDADSDGRESGTNRIINVEEPSLVLAE